MAITTLFLTGFEHGFIGAGAGAGGGLMNATIGSGWSASTSSPRNGNYCARVVTPATTATQISFPVPGNPTKFVMRFGVKFVAGPASNSSRVFTLADSGATVLLNVTRDPDGTISWTFAGSPGSAGRKLTDTNWHLFEWQIDTAAKTLDWKMDGVAQPRVTGTTGTPLNVATVFFGTDSISFPTVTYDYDDLICGSWTVAATDWYGDGGVLGRLAGADGTHATVADFSPGDAGTAYSGTVTNANTMVDDPPGTLGWTATRSTTDSIAQRTSATTAYIEIAPAATANAGSANAVRALLSYSSVTTTSNTMACIVRNSGGNPVVILGDLPTAQGGLNGLPAAWNVTANNFKGAIVTVPVAGWTAAEVNAVRWRVGGSNDVNPIPTVQALMLEVDWPPAVPAALLPQQHFRRPAAVAARRGATGSRGSF